MSSQNGKPALLPALFSMKCPSCRKSGVFVNKSMFPLGQLVMLKDHCDVCGLKLKAERNNGGGINYALTVILFLVILVISWPWLSYKDNSMYYYLIISTVVVVVAQPFLMRLSRMIYLYLYTSFGDKN